MSLRSPLIAKNVRVKIVDAPSTLTSMTLLQSLDGQQLYGKMHTVVLGSQYIVSMYKHLHRNAARPVNF